MTFPVIKDDFIDDDDSRGLHASHHNDIADRINFLNASFTEGTVGLPAGGQETNVLKVQKKKLLGWEGSRMVTPGGRPGLVMTLVSRNPARWDWRVPVIETYPNSRRRVNPTDPESEWFDGAQFGAFQGFWIVDPNDPIGNDQWGDNGDLWMVYDNAEEAPE